MLKKIVDIFFFLEMRYVGICECICVYGLDLYVNIGSWNVLVRLYV